jgi:hypothetical protein
MSEELCDGVKMLIERMQNNPEDFEYGGKLHGYRNTMEEVLRYPPSEQPMWFLSEAEKKALVKAYTDMHKQVFTANVVQAILSPEPEYDINMDQPYRNRSKLITPQYMLRDAQEILEKEFDKEYAKNSNV